MALDIFYSETDEDKILTRLQELFKTNPITTRPNRISIRKILPTGSHTIIKNDGVRSYFDEGMS